MSGYNVSASLQNAKVQQAIMSVADMAGATYELRPTDGLLEVYRPDRPSGTGERKSTDKAASDGYVGKISIPMEDGKYFLEFMLRQSDLPEELRTLRDETIRDVLRETVRDAKLKEAIKAIRD